MPPEHYPTHDLEWLEAADLYETLTETTVVNPRNLQPRTLLDIDREWLQSRARWHKWRKFFKDFDQRPPDLR